MRLTRIRSFEEAGKRRIAAWLSSATLTSPFELWFEVPSECGPMLDGDSADPWLAALLLPAMRAGAALEIDAPLTADLHEVHGDLQSVYEAWLPAATAVEVHADVAPPSVRAGTGSALLFSCGVDSWYSLLRADARRRHGVPSITHLVAVHGVDIDVGPRKADVARAVVANARRAADAHDLGLVPVTTNIRQLYTRLGISWRWGQAGALGAIGLALRPAFASVLMAAGHHNAGVIVDADMSAGGCHPLLMPLFSAGGCEVRVDAGEVSRPRKVAAVAASPLAMASLRVCWASHEPGYNCGRCAKCVRTMLELELAGALSRCATLPHVLDPQAVARIRTLFPHEVPALRDGRRKLAARGVEPAVLLALDQAIAAAEDDLVATERACEVIRSQIGAETPFVLVDAEELRFEIARTHRGALPFAERNGLFDGFPPDGAAAVAELEHLRAKGARMLVLWKRCFWVLDHYRELAAHIQSRYALLSSDPAVVVFDLRAESPAAAGQSPSATVS